MALGMWSSTKYDTVEYDGTIKSTNFIGTGIVPIGAVLPWLKNLTGAPDLPDGWAECNGQVLNDPQSVFNGQTIPNLNGADFGTKRFLRGSTTSGGTGGSDSHGGIVTDSSTTDTNTTTIEVDQNLDGTTTYVATSDHAHNTNPASIESFDNLPSYYHVVFIMRIR